MDETFWKLALMFFWLKNSKKKEEANGNCKAHIAKTNDEDERYISYKGHSFVAHAVYESGARRYYTEPICWAGRVDEREKDRNPSTAFVGVTPEEAAEHFKLAVDAYENAKLFATLSDIIEQN